ncbi:hypothetical protein E2C01_032876 [Portunus trituberculatus]|uniref:Uncharacterized protein n=1 Tax=Portunus trituberculatus TaxID=210409 RepID=A0A5B7EYL7_PORTR|nr:hypothetical protein [Portunus trituberculatus]
MHISPSLENRRASRRAIIRKRGYRCGLSILETTGSDGRIVPHLSRLTDMNIWVCMWMVVRMMVMAADVDSEDGSYITFPTPVPTHSVPHLMFRFLTELRRDYFPSCTLILLHDSPHSPPKRSARRGSSPGSEMMALVDLILKQDTSASYLVFIMNNSLPLHLHQVDLSAVTRCPVYVSVTWAVGGLLWALREPVWEWDKYLASRKHVIFNLGPADLVAEAIQVREYVQPA